MYPLSEFLLQQQAEQVVGHTEPDGSPNDQNLLQPGRERALVNKRGTPLDFSLRGKMTEKT